MNKDRLKHLIAILKKVPEEEFDIEHWYFERQCGTVACAAGWAAQDPTFMKGGLRLGSSYLNETRSTPCYQVHRGYTALTAFFETSTPATFYLFHPQAYDETPVTVAMVIRRVDSILHDDISAAALRETYDKILGVPNNCT